MVQVFHPASCYSGEGLELPEADNKQTAVACGVKQSWHITKAKILHLPLTSESKEIEVTLTKVPSIVCGLLNFSSAWQ